MPPKTLAQVLACLRRAGLVEAIEGDARERTCVLRGGPCDGSCTFHGTWLSAHEALLARLGGTTLRDIARGGGRAA